MENTNITQNKLVEYTARKVIASVLKQHKTLEDRQSSKVHNYCLELEQEMEDNRSFLL